MSSRMLRLRLLFAIAMLLCLFSFDSLLYAQSQQADFGRMFPSLPSFQPPEALLKSLALAMQDPNLDADNNPTSTPSGFTYLGQFLDHDITLMVEFLSQADSVLEGLGNNRTPRLDLDSMYGGGPVGNPQLYDAQGRFVFSAPNGFEDFQRDPTSGVAVVVEGRNDENLVIAQIHITFQKFHNHYINQGLTFSEAQQMVRWHWQWIVVHDFLPEIVGQDTIDRFLSHNGAGKPKMNYEFYKPGNPNRPMMPIEFSAAAYRFGHSMVRLAYVMPTGSTTKTQVFNAAGNDLHGSRPIPPNLKISFPNFFDIPGVPPPPGRNISRKIDALISKSLYFLPEGLVVPPSDMPVIISLPERNLLRAARIGLPSYQDVASAMGITPYTNAQLGLTDPGWGGKAPLWYGILKESELATTGARLGPTGGRIVAEVILGLIDNDTDAYFSAPQAWAPTDGAVAGEFHIYDLLSLAGALAP